MQQQYKYNKVLIIDDNEIDTYVNMKMMEKVHFAESIIVKNSEPAALVYLTQECEKDADYPDIIFLNPAMSPQRKSYFIKEFQNLPEVKDKNRLIIISVMEVQQQSDLASKRRAIFYQSVSKPLTQEALLKI
jgi:CheY-like chemotaxis protein